MKILKSPVFLFGILFIMTSTIFAASYTLTVDAGKKVGALERFWQKAIGSCHIYMTLNSVQGLNLKEHYALAKSDLGMQSVRAHGVLNEDVGIYHDKNGTVSYDWTRLDSIYDYLVSIDLKPFVELSFMPNDLASGSGTFGWYGGKPGNITPPKDYTKWRTLCYEFASHCQQRYGAEKIESWYWEVWNEPDISQFFTGNRDNYLRMYDYAVEGLLAANPNLKVGGPSCAIVSGGWIQALIDHCMTQNFAEPSKNSVKIDFISWHTYPGYDNPNGNGTHMAKSVKEVETILAQKLQQYPQLKLENILGEWNTTYKGGMSFNNEICASFVAKSIHGMFSDMNGCPAPDAASFWVISDIWEEWDVSSSLGFGPMGLILRQRNAKKPPYLTFQMLAKMEDTRVELSGNVTKSDPGLNGFATINKDSTQVQILIYNHSSGNGETATAVQEAVTLTVKNLPFEGSTVLFTRFGVDHDHNNSFTVWDNAGRPANPSPQLWNDLEAAGKLNAIVPETELDITNGSVTIQYNQYQPGVSLLLLTENNPIPTSMVPHDFKSIANPAQLHIAGDKSMIPLLSGSARTVDIYNMCGTKIVSLKPDGNRFFWNRKNLSGESAAPGSYVVVDNGSLVGRFVLLH